jgi:hypothetical protein
MTGSTTTKDIGQAEQFALSVVQSRPTHVATCICAPTRAWELEVLSHEVRAKETRPPTSRDPPLPLDSRSDSGTHPAKVSITGLGDDFP